MTEKPKKRINSKNKGKGFERDIAKKLTKALQPLNFVKTEGSGARVGGKNFELMGKMLGADALALFTGDVVPVNEKDTGLSFAHSIECKFYKTPDTFGQLVNGSANIFKWMNESIIDANKVNKHPILIFKWNNTPIYVATLNNIVFTPKLRISNDSLSINIYLFDDLLQHKDFWLR